MLPPCPKPLPADLDRGLRQLAALWARHTCRPRIKKDISDHWDAMVASWMSDEKMPLLIRKSEKGIARGEVIVHDSGLVLISTDNSPASWSYLNGYSGLQPTLADVRRALDEDKIPVAMVIDREMALRSRYKCSRSLTPNPNKLG